VTLGPEQPDYAGRVPGHAQRAIHIRPTWTHPEKIDRLLKKNRHMAFRRFRHALPLGGF
jgi:hypothetical protein